MRKIKFQTGGCYHIYNRGVDKREVFIDKKDFFRFLINLRLLNNNSKKQERDFIIRKSVNIAELSSGYPELSSNPMLIPEFNSFLDSMPKFVEIISYCFNFNHYHFLMKQLMDDGISKFMHKLDLGYTNYFNRKYNRSGSLFQGRFKAIHVKKYGHLLKLLVYVNCNYEVHKLGKAKDWIWSSYLDSVGSRNGTLCNLDIIKDEFQSFKEFRNFCKQVLPDIIENKELKKYLLE